MSDTPDPFEQHRDRLRAIASRMLGAGADADDAVQETWLRFHRADTSEVENLGAWLTTALRVRDVYRSTSEAAA